MLLFLFQPTHKKHCTFSEEEVSIGGKSFFLYGMTVTQATSGEDRHITETFYVGFRKNGRKLRGSQWLSNARLQNCLHFTKEHDRHSHLVAPRDPYAPDVNLEQHWNRHGPSPYAASGAAHAHHTSQHRPKPAPNHNAQWAPKLTKNQNRHRTLAGDHDEASARAVNARDGHVIRHSRRRHRDGNT